MRDLEYMNICIFTNRNSHKNITSCHQGRCSKKPRRAGTGDHLWMDKNHSFPGKFPKKAQQKRIPDRGRVIIIARYIVGRYSQNCDKFAPGLYVVYGLFTKNSNSQHRADVGRFAAGPTEHRSTYGWRFRFHFQETTGGFRSENI